MHKLFIVLRYQIYKSITKKSLHTNNDVMSVIKQTKANKYIEPLSFMAYDKELKLQVVKHLAE